MFAVVLVCAYVCVCVYVYVFARLCVCRCVCFFLLVCTGINGIWASVCAYANEELKII